MTGTDRTHRRRRWAALATITATAGVAGLALAPDAHARDGHRTVLVADVDCRNGSLSVGIDPLKPADLRPVAVACDLLFPHGP